MTPLPVNGKTVGERTHGSLPMNGKIVERLINDFAISCLFHTACNNFGSETSRTNAFSAL